MLRRPLLLLLALLLTAPCATAQTPDTWAQHVEYTMDISLKADRHRVHGTQRLVYTNNSPDTLRRVYYHLYFNAFQPTSMMAERNRHLPDPDDRIVPRIFNLGPKEVGWHRIQSLTQDGTPVTFKIRDTVMEVKLAHPIPPGTSTTFRMRFRSQVPLQTRRSGRDNMEGIDYSMTQWYPKMAAYDERGWHADPYVGREFYAPYGTFNVDITLPACYTIGGTGVLQNPEAVGHGYGAGATTYRPEDCTAAPSDSLTWRFVAHNVHDFAWAADPDYIHKQLSDDNYTYHLLFQPGVEERWRRMEQWVPSLIQFFSQEIGPYPYPQFTVAQGGDGGMEYPMLNLITGRRGLRSLLGVTAHEAAHEWFYATMGSNEADYAWMDEGFTSYMDTEGVGHVMGLDNPSHRGSYLSVLFAQDLGLFERLSTPADWFQTNFGYGIAAYPGGAMLVNMMGYVISDSLRGAWLKHYYNESKFEHPDPYELEDYAEDVSGLRLDWYFEQFTNTTRTLDYALNDITQQPTGTGYEATLHLERRAPIAMPQDVKLTLADGSTQWVNVPLLIMHGHKPVPDDWIVTEPWPWVYPKRKVTVQVPARVTNAEIDPLQQTPDVNRLNNSYEFPLEARFLRGPQQSWDHYAVGYRPLALYASNFGFGGGMWSRGTYLFGQFRTDYMLTLWPQVLFSGGDEPNLIDPDNVASGSIDRGAWYTGIDYTMRASHPFEALGPRATATWASQKHLGLMENRYVVRKPLSGYLAEKDVLLTASLRHQWNPSDRVFGATSDVFIFDCVAPCIPPIRGERLSNPFGQTHNASARLNLRAEQAGDRVSALLEVGSELDGSGSATRLLLTGVQRKQWGRFTGTASLQFGLAPRSLISSKRFVLGGVPYEARWRSDVFRQTYAAAAEANDLAPRLVAFGPSGPVAYLRGSNRLQGAPTGRNLLAGRLALEAQPVRSVAPLRPLRLSAFAGLGSTWNDGAFLAGFAADDLLGDAGFGARYNLSQLGFMDRWTAQSDVLSGLDLVAKFPLWASDPGLIAPNQDEWAFRWLVGFSL